MATIWQIYSKLIFLFDACGILYQNITEVRSYVWTHNQSAMV